jgi:serine/threonine-protein kinase
MPQPELTNEGTRGPMAGVLEPGSIVGPYAVLDLLGQGGMGVVYRAHDARLERTVALKVIAKGDARPADGSALTKGQADEYGGRLLREARAVASLNHPNVVAIYDVGETEELIYFSMEFVEGENLRSRIGDMSIPIGERIRWLADVASGLHAAHRAGLVHRDVKPENVMIRSDGIVKVLDFGIARRTRRVQDGAEFVTGEDQVTGTPLYMAPEQLRGERIDARSDQFSWAIVAYELLCGTRPFSSSTEGYALVASILSDPAPPLLERAPDVPSPVAATVHRALSKVADQRLATMEDVAVELWPHTPSARTTRPSSQAPSSPRHGSDTKHHEPAAFAETTRVPTTKDEPPREPPTSPDRTISRRSKVATAAGLVALGLLSFTMAKRPKTTAPKRPTPPTCSVPEAEAELKAARVHARDGAASEALRDLHRAVELDDTCATAHLELALAVIAHDPQEGLKHYQAAFHGRAALHTRELALLEASEPFIRSRPDLVEWETRLTAAVYRFPDDAPLRVWLGTSREKQLDIEGAKSAYEAASRMDPGFAPAWAGLANAEKRLGNRKAALGAVSACLGRSPVASVCVGARHEIHSEAGECALAKDDAVAWVALDPSSPEPQRALSSALFATSAPRPAVEEALRRRWALLPAESRKGAEIGDKLNLALADGRFDEALALADTLEPTLPPDADVSDHAAVAMSRVSILVETGQPKRAAEVAKDFLDRMMAYPPHPLSPDPSLAFVEPLFRAGLLSSRDLDAKRAEWQEREIARTRATDPAVLSQQRGRLSWFRWALVHGAFAETREEAQAALRAIPSDSEPPAAQRSLRFDFAAGKVLSLAGEHIHAVEHLRRVTDACVGFTDPQLRVRAHYHLGLALEARGDREGAKAAYRFVLDRWGAAKPRSITAEKAKTKLAALDMR